MEASTDKKVLSVRTSLEYFVTKVERPPIMSNIMEMNTRGIVIAFAISQIIEAIECLWCRICITTDTLSHSVTNYFKIELQSSKIIFLWTRVRAQSTCALMRILLASPII